MIKRPILLAGAAAEERQAIVDCLRESDYDVADADTGEEALRVASAVRPMVVIVDLQLPGLAALDVVARLAADDDLPCIVLGAVAEPGRAHAAAAAGAVGFLLKPVTAPQLAASVELALGHAAAIRELQQGRSQLERALQQGRETSVAIGILMVRQQLGERAAFDLLRGYSRRNRRKLSDVAAELVRNVGELNDLTAAIAAPPDN